MIVLNSSIDVEYISSGLFKSKGAWCHPNRVIDSYEIIFVYEGTVYICEDGVEYTVNKNDILILEPDKTHYGFKESEKFVSFSWLHFSASEERCKLLPKHLHASEPHTLKTLFTQCLHTVNTPTYDDVCADLYTALIIEEILVLKKAEEISGNYLSAQVKEWIRVNIEKDISVSCISKEFGYHENHISRLFKSAYGIGIKVYITKMKLENAKNLLSTTMYSVKEISQLLSFKSENHFIKFFKYHVNLTPTEYRNTYVNTHINKQ